jgi:hypothetical protein
MRPQGDSQVIAIDPRDPRVDAYALRHPAAAAYHLGAWAEVLSKAYGFRPQYLALAGGSGELTGLLPLMYRKSLLSSARLNSLPSVPSTGPVADAPEGEVELVRAACRLRENLGADMLMIKSRTAGYERALPGLRRVSLTPTWRANLPDDPEILRKRWKKRSSNLWRNLRKAEANDVVVRLGGEPDVKGFYDLYLRTMRKHRSLPRPRREMQVATRLLPPGVSRLFVAEKNGVMVAASLWHAFGETLELLYSASDERALGLRPNHAMYAAAAVWAIEHDKRLLDFGGAAAGSPLAAFKAQWTAYPVEEYQYVDTGVTPVSNGSDDQVSGAPRLERLRRYISPRQPAVSRVWGATPLSLTRAAGELVYRYL